MKIKTVLLSLLIVPMICQAQNDSLKMQAAIGEVVVMGSRHHTTSRLTPISVSVISKQKIEQQHNSSLLPTLSQQVPGLFITSRGVMGYGVSTGAAGTMSLRGIGGAPSTAMLVAIDGVPQYMGLMGHPIADVCHSMMAESVEVLRGASSVLYGSNAMGGVINIVTQKMQQDGVEDNIELSYGSFNTLQSAITNRIKSGRFSSSAGATYNRTDGHRADMGFEQIGGNLHLAYDISSNWNISASGQVTHFNASNPGSVTEPIIDNDSRITRYASTLSVKNNYEKTSGAINLFYNAGRHRINDGYSAGEEPLSYRFNSRDEMWGVSIFQNTSLFQGNNIIVGIDYQHFGGKAWNKFLDGEPDKVSADKTMDEIAAYCNLRQRIARIIMLDVGLRYDHHSKAGAEWIPQAGISLLLPRQMQLKAMVSKGFRFPTIREMYMFPPQNPDLKPESVINYELSLQQSLLDGRVSYGVNIYYIDGKNIIRTQPVDGRPLNINIGKVENWGVEMQVAWQITKAWRTEANYSYLNMRYPVAAAPKHKLYASVSYSHKRWSVSSGAQYINGLITLASPLTTQKGFVLWNANAEYSVTPRLRLFATIDNILDTKYQINAGYPMPGTTFMGGLKFKF